MYRAVLLSLTLAAVGAAQEEAKPNPELPDKLDTLRDAVADRRMERDAEGVAVLDQLAGLQAAGMHPSDQRKVVTAVARTFFQGRVRGPEQVDVYLAAARLLGGFGEVASRDLALPVPHK